MKNITAQPDITIRQAMKALDETAEKCLIVVDENNFMLGTLTDGDLRRKILFGAKFSENISTCFNAQPTVVIEDMYSLEEVRHLMYTSKLDLMPVLDQNNKVVDYINWSDTGGEMFSDNSLWFFEICFLQTSTICLAPLIIQGVVVQT